jgi:hypothetical protein
VLIGAVWALPSQAATLTWDRNSEADMKDYQVWACFTPNCVVIKSPGMLQPGTVNQPASGVKPQYNIDLTGKEGAAAVSARDQSLNESGLSVAVPFDQKPPTTPTNPAFQ